MNKVGIERDTKCRTDPSEDCPMTRLIGLLASKWAMPVLYHLLRAGAAALWCFAEGDRAGDPAGAFSDAQTL